MNIMVLLSFLTYLILPIKYGRVKLAKRKLVYSFDHPDAWANPPAAPVTVPELTDRKNLLALSFLSG